MQSIREKGMNTTQEGTLQTSVAKKCYPPKLLRILGFPVSPSSIVFLDFFLDMPDPGLIKCVFSILLPLL